MRPRFTFTLMIAISVASIDASYAACSDLAYKPSESKCTFDANSLTYMGSPTEQAQCLLTPVLRGGVFGPKLTALPSPLDRIVGVAVSPTLKSKLREHLRVTGVAEADVGGNLNAPLSRARSNDSRAPVARYFIIHDTSSPEFRTNDFPPEINEPSWPANKVRQFWRNSNTVHIYNGRSGESWTMTDFAVASRSTCFEMRAVGLPSRGLFLGIENVQPRRFSPNAGFADIAPAPGFSAKQLDRLALIYAAASSRAGVWMIPAYHAVIDSGFVGAHDDPQNFDLIEWGRSIERLLVKIN